ncbi:MAG: tetratricopeptide repeat protein [Limisphaerales bacterium]
MNRLIAILFLLSVAQVPAAAPFSLSDSDPNSPEFRRRFLANNGVNEAIEPKLTQEDRPLQEAILPHLQSSPQTAINLIEQSLTPETNPAFYTILGNLYYQANNYASAERYLKQSLEKFPTLRRSWRTLALTYVQRSMFKDAVAPLLQVIKLGGGDDQSYGLLAYAYLNNEKYESALSAYRMARMFKPDSLDFRRGQAQCLLQTEQHHAAIALFDELLDELPTEKDFWLLQANSFLALGRPIEAIANLEIVADSGQADWASLMLLGDLHLNEDLAQVALKVYQRAVRETTPGDWSQVLRPLRYLLDRRLFAEAKTYLDLIRDRAAGKLDPIDTRRMNVSEAHIEMEIGDANKAFEILTQVIAEDPLDGQCLLLLSEHHQRRSEFEKAEFYLERATNLDHHRVEAYIALGRLEVTRGRLKASLPHLRQAQQLRPSPNVERYIESIQRAIDAMR